MYMFYPSVTEDLRYLTAEEDILQSVLLAKCFHNPYCFELSNGLPQTSMNETEICLMLSKYVKNIKKQMHTII